MSAPYSDDPMMDLMGGGDAQEESREDKAISNADQVGLEADEDALGGTASDGNGDESFDTNSSEPEHAGLPKVLKAFQILQADFDAKFKKMWA